MDPKVIQTCLFLYLWGRRRVEGCGTWKKGRQGEGHADKCFQASLSWSGLLVAGPVLPQLTLIPVWGWEAWSALSRYNLLTIKNAWMRLAGVKYILEGTRFPLLQLAHSSIWGGEGEVRAKTIFGNEITAQSKCLYWPPWEVYLITNYLAAHLTL
jgi:hypothetical protein